MGGILMARTTRKAGTKRGSKSPQKSPARKKAASLLSKKQEAMFYSLLGGSADDESE